MSIDLKAVSNTTDLMAHTVILGSIIASMPKDRLDSVRAYALTRFDENIKLEKAKKDPNPDVIAMLEDAKHKAMNFLGRC